MKNKNEMYPIVFLIFGIILMMLVSGLSIRRYIKNMKAQRVSKASSEQKEDSKIFFNKPEIHPENTSLKIYKSKKVLELYGDNKLIGRFKIGLGTQEKGAKEKEGDNKTPEGSYYVCYINANSKYKYFFGISYPNIKDAKNGLEKNIIDKTTYNSIKIAIEEGRTPPWHTALGGEIGIHGGGTESNWTYGCIALDDKDIDILKNYINIKSPVYIYK